MKSESISGLRLYYPAREQEAARLIADACEKSVVLLRERWGLEVPSDCRVYVMTSWFSFLYQSSPWWYKSNLLLAALLAAPRYRAVWSISGGWSVKYGRRRAVGIKPPALLQVTDTSIGDEIYLPTRTLAEKVETVTCHELFHAFTFHLRLPGWMNEGLALLAMERYLGRPLIRRDTLSWLGDSFKAVYIKTDRLQMDRPLMTAKQFSNGYWLTRYLDETKPEMLRELLSRRHRLKDLMDIAASAYGKPREEFWRGIEADTINHFRFE